VRSQRCPLRWDARPVHIRRSGPACRP
jgi:hypothetical protein